MEFFPRSLMEGKTMKFDTVGFALMTIVGVAMLCFGAYSAQTSLGQEGAEVWLVRGSVLQAVVAFIGFLRYYPKTDKE